MVTEAELADVIDIDYGFWNRVLERRQILANIAAVEYTAQLSAVRLEVQEGIAHRNQLYHVLCGKEDVLPATASKKRDAASVVKKWQLIEFEGIRFDVCLELLSASGQVLIEVSE